MSLTPAAFKHAPSPSPNKPKAAPGLGGPALLARIVYTSLDSFTRSLPRAQLLDTTEWNAAEGTRFQSFKVSEYKHHEACFGILKL